jgi:hypothetical protein
MTVTLDNLATVGNVVDSDYRHVSKVVTPAEPLLLPDAVLKWYQLGRADQVVEPSADAGARDFVRHEAAAGRLPISGDLGFAIHHLAGDHIHLLLVFTWRENNEMWETCFWRDARGDAPYQPVAQGTHRPVICVWEFAAVAHEHEAWTRYLRSPRDEAAKRAYVEDVVATTI